MKQIKDTRKIIITELGLGEGSKGVITPGVATTQKESDEDEGALNEELRRAYRGLVARANYLAQDRADIQFAVERAVTGNVEAHSGKLESTKKIGQVFTGKDPMCSLVHKAGQGQQRDIHSV